MANKAPKTDKIPAGAETAPETKPGQKCLNPACENMAKTRGLCCTCYAVARKAVKDGQTTWEKLVAAGKALKRGERTGTLKAKARDWFLSDAPKA